MKVGELRCRGCGYGSGCGRQVGCHLGLGGGGGGGGGNWRGHALHCLCLMERQQVRLVLPQDSFLLLVLLHIQRMVAHHCLRRGIEMGSHGVVIVGVLAVGHGSGNMPSAGQLHQGT